MCDFRVLLESQQDRLGPDPQSTYWLGYYGQLQHECRVCMQGLRKAKRRGRQLQETRCEFGMEYKGRLEGHLHTRWHHSPTNLGVDEVQALGRRVSRLLRKPCMTLKPVTLAVMDARVAAARALVEIWPMEMVPATRSEYWRRWLEQMYRTQYTIRRTSKRWVLQDR